MYYTKIAKQEKNKEKVKQTHTDTETHSLTQKSPKNFKPKSIIYTKMTYKTKRKKIPDLKIWNKYGAQKKSIQRFCWVCFMFPTYCWAWAPPWGMFCFSLGENYSFSFVNAYQLWAASQKGWGSLSTSPFQFSDPIWYRTIQALFLLPLSLQVHMYNLLLWKPCFLRSSIPSGSHGLSTSSSVEFPESWRERLDGDIPFKM